MGLKSKQIRSSKEFNNIINGIRIEFLKKGKTPPSTNYITKVIASKIKKEDLLYDEFIKFK